MIDELGDYGSTPFSIEIFFGFSRTFIFLWNTPSFESAFKMDISRSPSNLYPPADGPG